MVLPSRDWPVHQLDVKSVFLHGDLHKTVHSTQLTGFVDPEHPNHVCLLRKSLYGLKQAPRAWFSRFATHIHELGFKASLADSSLFVLNHGANTMYLLLYVDDIVLTASSLDLLQRTIAALQREFSMKDLGDLYHFLGMQSRDASSAPRRLFVSFSATVHVGYSSPCWYDRLQTLLHSG